MKLNDAAKREAVAQSGHAIQQGRMVRISQSWAVVGKNADAPRTWRGRLISRRTAGNVFWWREAFGKTRKAVLAELNELARAMEAEWDKS